jgi:NOL1/NOP2/sun family putative RNA methylase
MQIMLGEDYLSFLACLSSPSISGLRVNTLKTSTPELLKRLAYTLTPVPWSNNAYWFENPHQESGLEAPGKHPYHAAGLFYLQEPSAMLPAQALDPQSGERILDLCAAPGGKSTQLASLMGDLGLLVANEIHPKRVWELAENLERWGAHNAVILNETPERLAEHFGEFFDRVLVDAPCSGEGMFRKSETARQQWSPELVRSCAMRQSDILAKASSMVIPGGRLVYSTCTYNPQENEAVISRFLKNHPDFTIQELPDFLGKSPARPDWLKKGDRVPGLEKGVRLWPHTSPCEGHFVALLNRTEDHVSQPETIGLQGKRQKSSHSSPSDRLPGELLRTFEGFFQNNLDNISFDPARLRLVGSYTYYLPDPLIDLSGLRTIHPGWWLGRFKPGQGKRGGRFEPSHALVMGLKASQVLRMVGLEFGDPRVLSYLRGEVISDSGENGWALVTVDDHTLGWGKRVQGKVKNYLPHGLRFR